MNSDKIPFQCRIENSDPLKKLDIKVLLNDSVVYYNPHVSDPVDFKLEIDDSKDLTQELVFEMSSKLPEHTKIDADGNIVEDAMIKISNVTFDDIDISYIFTTNSVYSHDFNGTQDKIETTFYGNMGCNGRVSLKFSNPIYLWLLENM